METAVKDYFENSGDIISKTFSLLEKTRYSDCLKMITNYMARNSYDASGYYCLGISYLFNKNYDLAISSFEKGLRLNPKDCDNLFGYGIVLLAVNRINEGEKILFDLIEKRQLGKDELLNHSAMCIYAGLFFPTLIFLKIGITFYEDIYRNDKEFRDTFDHLIYDGFKEYITHSCDAARRYVILGNDESKNISITDDFIQFLIAESYWVDALKYFMLIDIEKCTQKTILGIKEIIKYIYKVDATIIPSVYLPAKGGSDEYVYIPLESICKKINKYFEKNGIKNSIEKKDLFIIMDTNMILLTIPVFRHIKICCDFR